MQGVTASNVTERSQNMSLTLLAFVEWRLTCCSQRALLTDATPEAVGKVLSEKSQSDGGTF